MMCLYPDLGSASDWLEFSFRKHYQDLGSDTTSVWNFFARYSDVFLRGLKWPPRETSAVFSGYISGKGYHFSHFSEPLPEQLAENGSGDGRKLSD